MENLIDISSEIDLLQSEDQDQNKYNSLELQFYKNLEINLKIDSQNKQESFNILQALYGKMISLKKQLQIKEQEIIGIQNLKGNSLNQIQKLKEENEELKQQLKKDAQQKSQQQELYNKQLQVHNKNKKEFEVHLKRTQKEMDDLRQIISNKIDKKNTFELISKINSKENQLQTKTETLINKQNQQFNQKQRENFDKLYTLMKKIQQAIWEQTEIRKKYLQNQINVNLNICTQSIQNLLNFFNQNFYWSNSSIDYNYVEQQIKNCFRFFNDFDFIVDQNFQKYYQERINNQIEQSNSELLNIYQISNSFNDIQNLFKQKHIHSEIYYQQKLQQIENVREQFEKDQIETQQFIKQFDNNNNQILKC